MGNQMVKEKSLGLLELSIKGNLRKGKDMIMIQKNLS